MKVKFAKSIRSSLDVTIEAENIRVVSADKLSVQVLATALAGITPAMVSLSITEKICFIRTGASKCSLPTADTFLSFVAGNINIYRGKMMSACLRFVAVQTVTGVLREDEGHSV